MWRERRIPQNNGYCPDIKVGLANALGSRCVTADVITDDLEQAGMASLRLPGAGFGASGNGPWEVVRLLLNGKDEEGGKGSIDQSTENQSALAFRVRLID